MVSNIYRVSIVYPRVSIVCHFNHIGDHQTCRSCLGTEFRFGVRIHLNKLRCDSLFVRIIFPPVVQVRSLSRNVGPHRKIFSTKIQAAARICLTRSHTAAGSNGLSHIAETPACCTAASRLSLSSLVTIRTGIEDWYECWRICSVSSRPSISGIL